MKKEKHFLAENYKRLFGKALNENEQSTDAIINASMEGDYQVEEDANHDYDYILLYNVMDSDPILDDVEFSYIGVKIGHDTLNVKNYPTTYDEPGFTDVTGQIRASKIDLVDGMGEIIATVPTSNRKYASFVEEYITDYMVENWDFEDYGSEER